MSIGLIYNQNKTKNNNRVLVLITNTNVSFIDDLMKPNIVDDFCRTKNSKWGWYSDCGITCPITTKDGGTKYNCFQFSEFLQYSISKLNENGAK